MKENCSWEGSIGQNNIINVRVEVTADAVNH